MLQSFPPPLNSLHCKDHKLLISLLPLGDGHLIISQKLIFLRNRSHFTKIFSTSGVPAALSFRHSLTDTNQITFQLVLPNLLLVLKFVFSVHWHEEGFVCLQPFSSYGSGCNKNVIFTCKLCLASILILSLQHKHDH